MNFFRNMLVNNRVKALLRAGRKAEALAFMKSTRGFEGMRDFNRLAA